MSDTGSAHSAEAALAREKKTLRKAIVARREALAKDLWKSHSLKAAQNALSLLETLSPQTKEASSPLTITAFLSFGSEIDTRPLIGSLLDGTRSLRLLLPSLRQSKTIILRPYDRETPLLPGPFGILEPETALAVPPCEVDVFFLPGIAFDQRGGRLGYGKGYFDRLLAERNARGIRVGLAFSNQIVEKVPTGPYDHPMHYLVTEEGWVSCG
ncbi:MAG: 5-formyltetrahydrofolate cyclo-ligase [Leptospirillia bacterium]